MRKPDDSSLTPEQYINIRKEAERRLREADAFGVFPTPVDDIMAAAKILMAPEDILDDGFIAKMRYKATKVLKSAIQKIWGVFDATARMIFIDRSVIKAKQTFLKLHEIGHAALPHQDKIFSLFEDCKMSLDSETSELFDREANVFATEVLFQLDRFEQEAFDMNFGIKVPMDMSKRYGASVYATIRRYVHKNDKDCAVLVLNQPQVSNDNNFNVSLRRFVASPSFMTKFGDCFPDHFTPQDEIWSRIPLNRAMSRPFQIALMDRNGDSHECVAECFNNTYQIFVLIHVKKTLNRKSIIILPNAFVRKNDSMRIGT